MAIFEVRMRCVVEKLVTVECEDEAEAESEPWDNAVDEMETDMIDWDVTSVKEIVQ